jgi:hypothetical protein
MTARTYVSAEAFKQSLEQRLRDAPSSSASVARRRQLLVFDRLLARLVIVLGDAVILKGGLALELRLARARSTKDRPSSFAIPMQCPRGYPIRRRRGGCPTTRWRETISSRGARWTR